MKFLSGLFCLIIALLTSGTCADMLYSPADGSRRFWPSTFARMRSATKDVDSDPRIRQVMDAFHEMRRPEGMDAFGIPTPHLDRRRGVPSLAAMLPLLGVMVQAWALYVGVGATTRREAPARSESTAQDPFSKLWALCVNAGGRSMAAGELAEASGAGDSAGDADLAASARKEEPAPSRLMTDRDPFSELRALYVGMGATARREEPAPSKWKSGGGVGTKAGSRE